MLVDIVTYKGGRETIPVDANGVGAFGKSGDPRRDGIDAAKAWLSANTVARETPDMRCDSYGLKHVMESDTGLYVGNGAFIVAAAELGICMKFPDRGPNVHLCVQPTTNAARRFWYDPPKGSQPRRTWGRRPKDTAEAKIRRMETSGQLDPKCAECAADYQNLRAGRPLTFKPSHKPSPGCRSGGGTHCSCDGCF